MRLIGYLLVTLCLSRVVLAAEINVLPGRLLITDVPVGKLYEVSVPLTIVNHGKEEQSYSLSTTKLSAIGAEPEIGYVELPDERWFNFATETITIKPSDLGQVKMYINIPNNEKYYNQHWVVGLRVAANSGTQSLIRLALYPIYRIETEAKAGIRGTGKMGIVPSVIELGQIKGYITIFNNDKQAHVYKITLINDPGQIGLSSTGYTIVQSTEWIQIDKHEVRIKPGGKARIGIRSVVTEIGKDQWKGMLLIEADDGEKGFVRIRV